MTWSDLSPVSNIACSALSEAVASPEHETMVECTEKLVAGIAKGPEDIADALFSKRLIAEDVRREISLSLTATDKARKLVENVTSEVKEYPNETFPTFLEILRSYGWLDKLVRALEDTFAQQVQHFARLPLPQTNQQQQQQPAQQPQSFQRADPGFPTSASPNFRTSGESLPSTAATHTQSFSDGQACAISDHSKPLTCDDLREVFNSVKSLSPKWHEFALQLGLKFPSIKGIEADNRADCMKCLMEVLYQWLNLNDGFEKLGRPSWKLLAKSVKQLDQRLFEELYKRHSIS